MTLNESEAGRASTFDDVATLFDQKQSNVRGEGFLHIDEESDPIRIAWHPSESHESNPSSSEQAIERLGLYGGNFPQIPLDASTRKVNQPLTGYDSRLTYLRFEAIQDGCELNLASESDFKAFIRSTLNLHRGNLVVLENGNLRMIWRDSEGTQLGIQFLGGKTIQFVIFKKRTGSEQITRVAGRDSISEITNLVQVFDLQSLLFK